MTYTCLHHHTGEGSMLDGFGSCKEHVARAKELKLKALSITEHGNTFSHYNHLTACKAAGIKPILGIELYCSSMPCNVQSKENRSLTHQVLWAKNLQGWKELNKLVTYTNQPQIYYYKPRISLFSTKECRGLDSFCNGNWQSFSGHMGSYLSDNLFCDVLGDPAKRDRDLKIAYAQYQGVDTNYYTKFLRDGWLEETCKLALRIETIFGKDNFFIELQDELDKDDRLPCWIHPLICDCLRKVSKATGIKAVASCDPHYASPEDAKLQRLVLMTKMRETEESVEKKLTSSDELDVMVFFGSNSFYIKSYDEMAKKFTKEELDATNAIADQIATYELTHKPYIPQPTIPSFNKNKSYLDKYQNDSAKYMVHLCVEGAKRLKPWTAKEWDSKTSRPSREDYWNRLQSELDILLGAGLENYFLTVRDYCMAADNRPADHSFDWETNLANGGKIDPIPRGRARGSAAGCLVSYLLGITFVDPLLYGLLMSRFYNHGRNTKDHIELPDIDIDYSSVGRDWILKYITYKYGEKKVAGIVTFQRMQGKAAIKDVFRVKGVENAFDIANEISEYIPGEAEIADEIQAMIDAGHEDYGIIQWALDNSPNMQKYAEDSRYKELFELAIKCEGTKRGVGKHPSGIVITPIDIEECFPMVLDNKTDEQIIGCDMNVAASMGGTKVDILGTVVLDKLKMVEDLVNQG